ncbi:restriction endonuclease [uncultured Corynebacterium sp.]|uniref:restriction endonuclease n=1 Tax=uncultured Corynebacterium sp. TaxID=159447 RepID=UPI002597A885|nr:restriction endonuclease [uncultured Corynebacterium sp.]
MASFSEQGMPTHQELVLPVLRALKEMGDSAASRDIITQVAENYPDAEKLGQITYPTRPNVSVLEDRAGWSLSTAKRIGAIEQPSRGMYLITEFGEKLRRMPEHDALELIKDVDREKYREQRAAKALREQTEIPKESESAREVDEGNENDADNWREQLLNRLHQMTPEGFEKFIIFLLKQYDLKLTHIGGSGDEGIDAIGTAPLSPVLSSRVAVQVKRYRPDGRPIGRETVALFQRDAMTRGAERAILVTLSRFTDAARKAATDASPTVDLIGGHQLTDLILKSENCGVQLAPVVNEKWFDRFD